MIFIIINIIIIIIVIIIIFIILIIIILIIIILIIIIIIIKGELIDQTDLRYVRNVIFEIARSLNHIHSKNIIHGDLLLLILLFVLFISLSYK